MGGIDGIRKIGKQGMGAYDPRKKLATELFRNDDCYISEF